MPLSLPNLYLDDYTYELPEASIAKFPSTERDQSKLLVYRQGKITDQRFFDLPDQLPPRSQLFFNNTRVIPARLIFHKEETLQGSGARIEIFLLSPQQPSSIMSQAMAARGSCAWRCLVGNRRRWKQQQVLHCSLNISGKEVALRAQQTEESDTVRFWWDDGFTFAEVVEASGQVPLPPYLNRAVADEDKARYQTVYSTKEGAVAAPTAGLHFTESVLEALRENDIGLHYLTLHVSAGTFQPIKEADVTAHPMHSEQIVVTQDNLLSLLDRGGPVIPVGTTSMRTLESLYWYGVKLSQNPDADFRIEKLTPYHHRQTALPTLQESVEHVLTRLQRDQQTQLVGETEIFIFPGYTFRACEGLITNFHQPKSTLILLIAALVGESWRRVYDHALRHEYRFLSYGDSSLLLP